MPDNYPNSIELEIRGFGKGYFRGCDSKGMILVRMAKELNLQHSPRFRRINPYEIVGDIFQNRQSN